MAEGSNGACLSPHLDSHEINSAEGTGQFVGQGTFMGKMDLATVMQTDPSLSKFLFKIVYSAKNMRHKIGLKFAIITEI